jgi:hypothetical protein
MSADLGREARRSRRQRLPGSPPVRDLLAEPLVEDTLYQVGFELDMGDGRRVPIVAGIQVLDSRLDEDGLLCTGARFIHLEGAHARQLVQWLRVRAEAE